MTSLDQLRSLFRFNDWANRRVVAVLKREECEEGVKLMSHVLTTEAEYYARLFGKDSTGFDFWPDADTDDLSRLAKENAEKYESLLQRFDDEGLGQIARYHTSEGEQVSNTYREMLMHVVLHSMSHRGQALARLRMEGIEPPVVDYIIYGREIQ